MWRMLADGVWPAQTQMPLRTGSFNTETEIRDRVLWMNFAIRCNLIWCLSHCGLPYDLAGQLIRIGLGRASCVW